MLLHFSQDVCTIFNLIGYGGVAEDDGMNLHIQENMRSLTEVASVMNTVVKA
jgi:hypothetical protein